MKNYLDSWCFGHPLKEIGAGMVSTFALIPEVIGFSYISGVSPASALFATFMIAVILAVIGGRPGMISGAAGSVALVAAPIAYQHGLPYLAASTFLAGIFQFIAGFTPLEKVIRLISKDVVTGFANGLAILIFAAQMPHLIHASLTGWIIFAIALVIIYVLPRFFEKVPSPLICVFLLTFTVNSLGLNVPAIRDLGELPTGLPVLSLPHIKLNLESFWIILPSSVAIASVGILESLLTLEIADMQTKTAGNAAQECRGLGIANMGASLIGTVDGCGMIGQTVGNIRYGGRGRISIFVSGIFLLFLMVSLHQWVAQVPIAALVAIMVMVSVSTFSWESLKTAKSPQSGAFWVILLTTFIVVGTRNLALGVLAGMLLSKCLRPLG